MSTLRISSTIGPVDAGIISALTEEFTKKTNIPVSIEKAGSGKTLENAKKGNIDLVIVHAPELEQKFVLDGYGIDKRDVMYNEFVILGSKSDPAKIKGKNAIEALKAIAETKSLMVTRGDNSGTHVKELTLWKDAGINPSENSGDWYKTYAEGDKGNKETALYADKENAYILIDRATWLIIKDKVQLEILAEKDEHLLNFFSLIRVNPDKLENINAEESIKFANWLVDTEGQKFIREFGVKTYGEPLFFPNRV